MKTITEGPTSAKPEGVRDDDLLTKQELATKLKKTPRCIELWMRLGYLPYIKVSRSVYFRWKDVVISLDRFRIN
jgi:hypothetical protein